MSDAEKKRLKKGDVGKVQVKEHRCLFIIKTRDGVSLRCNLIFKSENQLKEHKAQTQVLKENKRKAESSQPKPETTLYRWIMPQVC